MGSLELLSYFWSLNTILVVKIANFDFDGLSPPPTRDCKVVCFFLYFLFSEYAKIKKILLIGKILLIEIILLIKKYLSKEKIL